MIKNFQAVCIASEGEYARIQSAADIGRWKPLPKVAVREGFDFSWLIAQPSGERYAVFYDSLRQHCCMSAFPINQPGLLGLIQENFRFGRPPVTQARGPRVLYTFGVSSDMVVSADFEEVEPRRVFANLCSRPR